MKNIRIIPRLDIKGPNVVKPVQAEALRVVGDPTVLAQRYYREGADEVIYLDIVASLYQRNIDLELLKSVTADIFIPFTVGGGIRSLVDIRDVLRAGADKIAINTYAVHHPQFLSQAVQEFGSQCITLLIEAKQQRDGSWEVYTDGGREHSQRDVVGWAKEGLRQGVGEILITSIDKDGTKQGYDLELIRRITDFADVPVIACGGAGTSEHFYEAIIHGNADAVAAASVFHYQNYSIPAVKQYLQIRQINVRI
jgi:cyclase